MFIHSRNSHNLFLDNRGKTRMVFYPLLTTYFLFYLKLAEFKKGQRYSVLPWKCGLFKFKILVYASFLCAIHVIGLCRDPPISVEPYQGEEQQY